MCKIRFEWKPPGRNPPELSYTLLHSYIDLALNWMSSKLILPPHPLRSSQPLLAFLLSDTQCVLELSSIVCLMQRNLNLKHLSILVFHSLFCSLFLAISTLYKFFLFLSSNLCYNFCTSCIVSMMWLKQTAEILKIMFIMNAVDFLRSI